jgi:hypothetical protein
MLKCEYRGGKPEPITSWLFNGNLLNTFSNKYATELNILTINGVSKADGGIYTCILSNGYHAQQSLNFTLSVRGKQIGSACFVDILKSPPNSLILLFAADMLVTKTLKPCYFLTSHFSPISK